MNSEKELREALEHISFAIEEIISERNRALVDVKNLKRELSETNDTLEKTEANLDKFRALLESWWKSSSLSTGDGTYLAWFDQFSRDVKAALADEPPEEP
jgi:peptidoglycan hydrolase CwlO-like protein